MGSSAKNFLRFIFDFLIFPIAMLSALFLKLIRKVNISRLKLTRSGLQSIGLLPVLHHYYEPVVYDSDLFYPLDRERNISGLDLNVEEQLSMLNTFCYQSELIGFPIDGVEQKTGKSLPEFYYNNPMFGPGDAEFLYSIVRKVKPKRILEVGSGYSTLIAANAIRKNREEDGEYQCRQVCIEPYEREWLESTGAEIIRKPVQQCDMSIFEELEGGDILFIDSSHMIRPQGDVLFEYLEALGRVKPGVYVHVHDIFTPRDYLHRWVVDEHRLWNEQYLLEAYLCHNNEFRIVGALNYLNHNYGQQMAKVFPVLASQKEFQPKSFWLVRN